MLTPLYLSDVADTSFTVAMPQSIRVPLPEFVMVILHVVPLAGSQKEPELPTLATAANALGVRRKKVAIARYFILRRLRDTERAVEARSATRCGRARS